MLKKLIVAGAMVTAAAGMGLATPAHADGDPLVRKNCIGPNFGEKETRLETGNIAAALSATGNTVTDLIHSENKLDFKYACGEGVISNIGNKFVQIKGDDYKGRWDR